MSIWIWVWACLGLVGLYFGVHWFYVLIMAAKAALEAGRLTPYWRRILRPAVVIGGVLDLLFQYTFGWIMFLERPWRGGWFFSGRVQYHYRHSTGWRHSLSRFWARTLNVFDDHIKP